MLQSELHTALLPRLGDGPTDRPERQRSVQAAIAWSYTRLSPSLQTSLQRLGVFSGGFTAPAAEALGVPRSELDALVKVNLMHRGSSAGRYGLLETVRAVALEQLAASGEAEPVHLEHAQYYRKAREGFDWDERIWV